MNNNTLKIGIPDKLKALNLDIKNCENYYLTYYILHEYDPSAKKKSELFPTKKNIYQFNFNNYSKHINLEENFKRKEKLLNKIGYYTSSIKLTTKKRLVIGLGIHSLFEIGLSLNPHLGIPYIPGSSLKGALRHYCEERKIEDLDKFFGGGGEEKSTGEIIFFDAYPVINGNLIKKDLLAPRFHTYYNQKGKKPPIEDNQPIIIDFVTIDKNVTFKFLLASKNDKHLKYIEKIFKDYLKTIGIGAKRNVDYGRFHE